jgi:hypothetical protein
MKQERHGINGIEVKDMTATVGPVLDELDCNDTPNGGDGGDAVGGDRGKDGDNGEDETLLC